MVLMIYIMVILVRPDARRRPRRRVATGLERTRLRRPRQSRSGANGRRPPGPTPATGAAPAQRGAAPARTFTDASPTRTSQPHLAAAAPTRRGAAEHLPAPRGPTTRTAAPRTGRVRPARPGPARGAASAGPGRAGPASMRTILYLQRDSNTSLHTHHASPAASSPPGPWRNGDPEPHRLSSRVMVRPRTLGPAPAIRSRSVRPRPRAGRPSGSGAKAIRNPPVAQPGRGHPSRTGIRARSLAADCSSPALGGPLLALARSDPEPHRLPGRVGGSSRTSAFSYQSRPAADRSSPSSERDAPGSGAVRSGTPPVARSSRRVEPRVSLQSPHRVDP